MCKTTAVIIWVLVLISTGFSQTSSNSGNSGSSNQGSSGQTSQQGSQTQGNQSGQGSQPQVHQPVQQSSVYDQWLRQRQADAAFNRLRALGEMSERPAITDRVVRNIETIYRKSSKKDLATVSVNQDDKNKFQEFLRGKNTGLVKLIPNVRCAENSVVISANEECLKYSVPGAGMAYSFRVKDYRIQRLSDLIFTGEDFMSAGVLSLAVLTSVGNVPLENLTLQTPGLKYLNDLNANIKYQEAVSLHKKFSKGVEINGYPYGRALVAAENNTYVLRSIAYNGRVMKSVEGITYNELWFDKRKDITVAFRIVRKDADGSVTILWKELNRRDSPELEQPKKEKETLESNKFTAKIN